MCDESSSITHVSSSSLLTEFRVDKRHLPIQKVVFMPLVASRSPQILAALRCGSGRSFVPLIRSAQRGLELRPPRPRYYLSTTTRSPARPDFARLQLRSTPLCTWRTASQVPTTTSTVLNKPSATQIVPGKRCLGSMHRAPAAMVTKPMVDPNIEIRTPRDPTTLSNYHNFVTRHTSLDFDIDFAKKRLFGSVVLTLESLTDEDVKDVILDSRYVGSFT